MVTLLVVVMIGFIIGAIIPIFFGKEKPKPQYRTGDMVVLKIDGREGMVIDNTFEFNSKSNCWKVKVRVKETEEGKKGLTAKILRGKVNDIINRVPETFNEFELEKQ
jgi:hypothetical protein